MATSQLSLYNAALNQHLGQAPLATLTDNVNSRYVLDNIWDSGNFRRDILEQGSWTFATRSMELVADPDLSTQYGYPFVFAKPTDWVRTVMVCTDPFYNQPLLQYQDEAGFWYASTNTIYVKYISMDLAYGYSLNLWPESMTRFAECYMAWRACIQITQDKAMKADLERMQKRLLMEARGRDAMEKPTGLIAQGRWATARMAGWNSRYGRGGGGGC